MIKLAGLTIIALLLATTLAATQPVCLPKSVFTKNGDNELPIMDLGYVNNSLTLCAYERAFGTLSNADKLLGCWTVDATAGTLGASAATAIPGRGRRADLDAQNCINGYCIPSIDPDEHTAFFATSTDDAHAAILTGAVLYIFETGTKAKIAEIPLLKPDVPPALNVLNVPSGLLYNGDTLVVIGMDAGPFSGATIFKENGDRAGTVGTGARALNIFQGGYGIVGRDKVALADGGLQNMTTVSGANVATQSSKRTVNYAPCTKRQFEQWLEGDDSQTGACKRSLDAKYNPYVDMSPVALSSGDIITTLSGLAQGDLAVLNRVGLTEVRRLKLARCP